MSGNLVELIKILNINSHLLDNILIGFDDAAHTKYFGCPPVSPFDYLNYEKPQ